MRTHVSLVQFAAVLHGLALLDPSSGIAKTMNDRVIGTLYNTIPHPPASYLGKDNWFRQADGGGNNLAIPDMGRGGRPYARSVQGKAGLPRSSLPEPELVFDSLLKRKREKVRSVRLHLAPCVFTKPDYPDSEPSWRNVKPNIRVCDNRDAFALPH